MRITPAALARAALGASLAALWCTEIWLLFAAAVGIVFVLARRSWLESHRWRPARVAVTAIAAARGWPAALADEVGAVVVESYRPRRVVVRAGHLLDERAHSDRWAASTEALIVADEAVRALPKPPLQISPLPRFIVCAAASAAALIWQWPPGLYVVAFVGALASLTDLREEREVRPPLVALRALLATSTVAAEPSIDPHLRVAFRAGSGTVIARANRLLDRTSATDQERSAAKTLLAQADRALPPDTASTSLAVRTWLPCVAGSLAVLVACG